MSSTERTDPPVAPTRAERLMRRYLAAETRFDALVVLASELKFTLAIFVVWSIAMIALGAKVFG